MSDTCKHCLVRGDIAMCKKEPCHTHESWYAQQLQAEIERLREENEMLRETLESIAAGPFGCDVCRRASLISQKVLAATEETKNGD